MIALGIAISRTTTPNTIHRARILPFFMPILTECAVDYIVGRVKVHRDWEIRCSGQSPIKSLVDVIYELFFEDAMSAPCRSQVIDFKVFKKNPIAFTQPNFSLVECPPQTGVRPSSSCQNP